MRQQARPSPTEHRKMTYKTTSISVNTFHILHNVENGTTHNASLPIGNHIYNY